MLIHILAAAQIKCLVHTDIHNIGIHTAAPGLNNIFNQSICFFLFDKQRIACIADVAVTRPAQCLRQMRKRLNARYDGYAELPRKVGQFAHILFCVTHPHVAEIRILRHFKRLFIVQKHVIKAKKCGVHNDFLRGFHIQDRIARIVEHLAVKGETGLFLYGEALLLRPCFECQKTAEKFHVFFIGDMRSIVFLCNGQAVLSLFAGEGKPAFAAHNVRNRAEQFNLLFKARGGFHKRHFQFHGVLLKIHSAAS